jgi:Ni/Fe-hydrogenase 1 B-type cytochrome subunit
MHWAHLLSFFVLIATGAQIHASTQWFGTIQFARQLHFITMYVFMLTAIVRIYWAFFGRGSAAIGSLRRQRDYHHFAMRGQDWKSLWQWVKYYLFLRKTRPPVEKYNPLQKLTYMVLFPLGILVMALTGFALFTPTASAFGWVAGILGGLNGVRLTHYLTMWVLIVFFMIHLYLVLVEDPKEAAIMFVHMVPEDDRVPGDYPAGSGGAGRATQRA